MTEQAAPPPDSPVPEGGRHDGAALRTAIGIGQAWNIGRVEIANLIGVQVEQLAGAECGADIMPSDEQRLRAGLMIAIYRALLDILGEVEAAHRWPTRTNAGPIFGGRTAVDAMLGGGTDAMIQVLRYLHSVAEGA